MEAEHKAKEAAGKAAEELKTLNNELQVNTYPNICHAGSCLVILDCKLHESVLVERAWQRSRWPLPAALQEHGPLTVVTSDNRRFTLRQGLLSCRQPQPMHWKSMYSARAQPACGPSWLPFVTCRIIALLSRLCFQACKRTLEHAQAENFTLNKDLVALKLAMQAVELADGAAAAGQVTTGEGLFPGPRSSTFSVAGGARGGAGRASTAQHSDAVLGFSGSVARGSVALLSLSGSGSGQAGGVGLLSPAGKASVVYGAGRLSALPASLGGSPQLPAQSTTGQALRAYAAGPRKSISAPHGSGPGT